MSMIWSSRERNRSCSLVSRRSRGRIANPPLHQLEREQSRLAAATESARGGLTAEQKSAEGVIGHVVGKASEALQCRKAEATDRPSRNGG
jgi:hypothetical protein